MASVGDELPLEASTILRSDASRALFEENVRLGYAQGEEGVYEMTLALWDWGFDPREIRQPVEVFYGDADGILSPKMPLHLADTLPVAHTRKWAGANHYGFVDRERWIDFVTAASPPADR